MTRSTAPLNRFLVGSDYSVYYREVSHFDLSSAPGSDYTIIAPLTGKLRYFEDNGHVDWGPSRILIIGPNAAFTFSGQQASFLQLTVSSAALMRHAISMHLVPPKSTVEFPREPLKSDQPISRLLQTLRAELQTNKPGREIVIRALVEQLLVQILRQYSIARYSEQLEISRVGLIDRRVRRSIELMHNQLDQELSLKDLAAASYLSPFHFARLFKKITGVTPHSYLAAIRTQKAQLLLGDQSLSINTVATRVGYLSSSHFTKAFRSATGTTPREFRKALIGTESEA